jgi:ABC-type nitrate/sulfonate/bicarbonate transport system substrate-binding protein
MTIILWRLLMAVAVFAASLGAAPALAQPLTTIRVSYQPNNYWALPFYVASEKNLWAAEGLKPEFTTFPSGAPQVTAGATDAWMWAARARRRRWRERRATASSPSASPMTSRPPMR